MALKGCATRNFFANACRFNSERKCGRIVEPRDCSALHLCLGTEAPLSITNRQLCLSPGGLGDTPSRRRQLSLPKNISGFPWSLEAWLGFIFFDLWHDRSMNSGPIWRWASSSLFGSAMCTTALVRGDVSDTVLPCSSSTLQYGFGGRDTILLYFGASLQ